LSFSFLICATKDFVDIGTATNDKLWHTQIKIALSR
jgi:hypothetical protein